MLTFLFCGAVFGQSSALSLETALTLPKGRFDFGLLNPLVVSVSDRVDLFTHPLLDVLLPNIGVKVNWLHYKDIYFSTRHRLSYATLLLNTISNPGTGGVLPADNTIPQIFTLDTQALGTYATQRHIISVIIGGKVAAKFPNVVFDTIDFPLLFSSTASYHAPIVFQATAGYRLLATKKIAFLFDGGAYLMPQPLGAIEVRQSTQVLFSFSRFFSMTAGYLATYGQYPYGSDWKIFPLLDMVFSLGGAL